MKKIVLKPKREASVRRFHPWVFSGAVAQKDPEVVDGDLVEVLDHQGRYLATGHYQAGSILVRLFSFRQTNADQAFWTQKIQQARDYRQALQLPNPPHTNCFRLVHAEGDGLPGLVIDWYAGTAVVQCHSIGMYRQLPQLIQALLDTFGDDLRAIYNKSQRSLPNHYGQNTADGYLFGQPDTFLAHENDLTFHIDWEGGQKTGFFLDQRENRRLLQRYASAKKVLNAFCYTGGFSLYALAAGARQVDSVDISERAMEWTEKNVIANFPAADHRGYTQDVLSYLKSADSDYDIIVVDPPAFAKSLKKRHQAVQGYKRLNAQALRNIRPGGLLFTFSCSQVVDKTLFDNTLVAAAIEAGRQVKIVHQLSQGPDHPINLFHPEGNYLKGLVLHVR